MSNASRSHVESAKAFAGTEGRIVKRMEHATYAWNPKHPEYTVKFGLEHGEKDLVASVRNNGGNPKTRHDFTMHVKSGNRYSFEDAKGRALDALPADHTAHADKLMLIIAHVKSAMGWL